MSSSLVTNLYYYAIIGSTIFPFISLCNTCFTHILYHILESQPTRDTKPMLFYCWSTVYDTGPKLQQHWETVLCFTELCGGCVHLVKGTIAVSTSGNACNSESHVSTVRCQCARSPILLSILMYPFVCNWNRKLCSMIEYMLKIYHYIQGISSPLP